MTNNPLGSLILAEKKLWVENGREKKGRILPIPHMATCGHGWTREIDMGDYILYLCDGCWERIVGKVVVTELAKGVENLNRIVKGTP